MGWRRLLISMEASRKRHIRNENRKTRIVQQATNKVSGALRALDKETKKELERIEKWESRLYEMPISKGGLSYDYQGKWTFPKFGDAQGLVQYQLELIWMEDKVQFLPKTIGYEKREFCPVSCCIAKYGTFIAFEISYNKAISGAKGTVLVNKSNPENSLIAIKAGDQLYFPTDGSIDGQVLPNAKRRGVVAFEGFEEEVSEFELVFIPKENNEEDDAIAIKVEGDVIAKAINDAKNAKSVLEISTENINSQRLAAEQKANASVAKIQKATKSGSGCFVLTMAILLAVFVAFLGSH